MSWTAGLAPSPNRTLMLSDAGADGNRGLDTPQERRAVNDNLVGSLLVIVVVGFGEGVKVDRFMEWALFTGDR